MLKNYFMGGYLMVKKELEIIKQAIINEVEGYEFYRMASEQAGTNESHDALMELANEELKHVEFLQDLFNKLKTSSEDDRILAFDANPPSPDIYNWKKVGKQHTSMAMSIFGIGIQLEKASIEFYEKAKAETQIKEAENLYNLLIRWEHLHLDQFTTQYNSYKEDWWYDQGFAPF